MRKQIVIYKRWISALAGGALCLLSVSDSCAEQVAPRFPDTELLTQSIPQSDVLSNQGQVTVTGRLLISASVLRDWVEDNKKEARFFRSSRYVTLILEGGGDDLGPPFPVHGAWGNKAERFRVRLKGGINYLTLLAPRDSGLMPLEVMYE